jgi:hypothetical protein
MNFVNLTGHFLRFYDEQASYLFAIPPSGKVARVISVAEPAGDVAGVPLHINRIHRIENLPDPQDGKVFIVSSFVLTALSVAGQVRPDVLGPDTAPGRCIRHTEQDVLDNPAVKVGSVKGVKGFQTQPIFGEDAVSHLPRHYPCAPLRHTEGDLPCYLC